MENYCTCTTIHMKVFKKANAIFHHFSPLLPPSLPPVPPPPPARDPMVLPNYYHPQWEHCAFASITNGELDEGAFNSTRCVLNKTRDDSSVRATFNSNLRLHDCEDCCIRWFVTLNGEECTDPAPIEAVIGATDVTLFSIHRASTITGQSVSLAVIL